MSPPRTRFAPSPTGYLHLGHALSAWAVEALAHAVGADMKLRIEDIDRVRCTPEYDAALIEDLSWLGLRYAGPVVRQSARLALYGEGVARLKDLGLLYPCSCTRRQVAATAPRMGPDGPIYGGTCRDRGPEPGKPVAWRLNMGAAVARAGPLDLDPRPWGDLTLVRRDVATSYHLSVVMDDADQGISHVMRGQDLEGITAVHVLLQRLLGLPTPIYAYHELIYLGDGRKLSKSERAPALRQMRAEGVSPEELRARLDSIPNLRGQIDAIKSGNFLQARGRGDVDLS